MKILNSIIVLMLLVTAISAQQDAQYTQFMFNKLAINPAFAGNWDNTTVTALQRSQWTGFEGAPNTQSLTLNAPVGSTVGLGLIASHDKIGAMESWNIGAAYAYKVKLSTGILSLGVQGAITRHQVSWNRLNPSESDDPLSVVEENSSNAPSFGMGVYYQQKRFYAGISVPRINEYKINSVGQNQVARTGIQQRHYYFMLGGLLYNADNLKLKTAALTKYTANSPIDIDFHTSLIFFNKLWTGVTLRHGGFQTNNNFLESADLVVQYQFSNKVRVGLAYDISLTEISQYNSGTYELMFFAQPFTDQDAVQNPRFF